MSRLVPVSAVTLLGERCKTAEREAQCTRFVGAGQCWVRELLLDADRVKSGESTRIPTKTGKCRPGLN